MSSGKAYLGDGVYASYDGMHVVLTTENGIEITNTVHLETYEVLPALLAFVEKTFKVEIKVTPRHSTGNDEG